MLISLFRGARSQTHRRAPATPRLPFVPRLEALEDRTVPATFTVRNLLDDGPGSLRDAVVAANASPGPDAIDFAGGLSGTITLTGGQLDVTDALTISGPGGRQIAVSGNDAS